MREQNESSPYQIFMLGLCAYVLMALGVQTAFPLLPETLKILDRLLHHSHVLTIRGDSYRLREKRRSGLLQKAGAAGKTRRTEGPINRGGQYS